MKRWLAAFSLLGLLACGGVETSVLVEVIVVDLNVPNEVNSLHFELSVDDRVVAERSYALGDNENRSSLTLVPEGDGAEPMDLVVYGLRNGTLVAESEPTAVRFVPDEVSDVTVLVCAGDC